MSNGFFKVLSIFFKIIASKRAELFFFKVRIALKKTKQVLFLIKNWATRLNKKEKSTYFQKIEQLLFPIKELRHNLNISQEKNGKNIKSKPQ